ncbi:hypothetical protein K439DRAFT_1661806 [Ramaria rubella]|nr:hypothetical protein K439DRAFT_1661806 [Ramaria rubella]
MLQGLQHVNLTVGHTPDSLELADAFYGDVLGLKADPVPPSMVGYLRWFRLGDNTGQQIHISLERNPATLANRSLTQFHPCFVLPFTQLTALRKKLNAFAVSGHAAACSEVADDGGFDAPNEGEVFDGAKKGDRFFVRDFCGNRLEFSGI